MAHLVVELETSKDSTLLFCVFLPEYQRYDHHVFDHHQVQSVVRFEVKPRIVTSLGEIGSLLIFQECLASEPVYKLLSYSL